MSAAEEDEIVAVAPLVPKEKTATVTSKRGMQACFPVEGVRQMGRTTKGTRATRLQEDDEVVGVVVL